MERNLRIITGLLLYIFVAFHLLNVSLGVVSAELVEQTRPAFMYLWSTRIGGTILLAALLLHGALGLRVLYHRNTLQMSFSDSLQFASGFLILPLMIPHAWGIFAMANILDTPPTYPILMQFFWIDTPMEGLRQVLLIIIVWIHGSIGIFTWLQLKAWWPRISLFVYPLIVIVPVMALLGFVEGGNLAIRNFENAATNSAQQYSQTGSYVPDNNPPAYVAPDDGGEQDGSANTYAENFAFVMKVKWIAIFTYLGILALVLIARFWRLLGQTGMVRIVYEDGTTINAEVGKSFLEISQLNNVPHANLCRGRGRCGTCRIKIKRSTAILPSPSQLEIDALTVTRSNADMRLACQCVPGAGEISIERLFEADVSYGEFRKAGREQNASLPSAEPSLAGDGAR